MFGLFSGKDDIEADTRVLVGIDEAAVNGQRVEDVGRGMSILYTCRAMGLDAREGIHFRIIMRAIGVRSKTPTDIAPSVPNIPVPLTRSLRSQIWTGKVKAEEEYGVRLCRHDRQLSFCSGLSSIVIMCCTLVKSDVGKPLCYRHRGASSATLTCMKAEQTHQR